jgi:hypothetical protein
MDKSHKPYKCRNTNYWAKDAIEGLIFHQQRYRLSDSNKNIDINISACFWNKLHDIVIAPDISFEL